MLARANDTDQKSHESSNGDCSVRPRGVAAALTQAGYPFVRYADEGVILCRRADECIAALQYAREVLSGLKLRLKEEKTVVTTFQTGLDLLGFHFTNRGRGIGTKSLRGFHWKVQETTRRLQGDRPVREIIATLNPLLRGWGTYHRHGRNVGVFTRLDTWLRKRLRAYQYKCWRSHARYPTQEEFEQMGPFLMRRLLRPQHPSQLRLI